MRLTTLIAAIVVIGLGYWAYHQTIQTQMADRQVDRLQRQIAAEHERLGVLRAEWAYLNRPDRLRELAMFNFERLGLLPLAPDQFGDVAQIPFPPPEPEEVAPELLQGTSSLPEGEIEPL
ncbi:cell division protein FtsL [Gymnodinialimonas hymeniacidonis]|uniref:cell division protein FtsL n=1 Tax=Gymnodinialimonas hymeniacidonis TaxID=3126508 RepID=UPI0034C66652